MKKLIKSVFLILLSFIFSQCGQDENIQTPVLLSDLDVKNHYCPTKILKGRLV